MATVSDRINEIRVAEALAGDLRKLSSDIRAHQRRTRRAEQRRAELVRQALAEGWTHARIAEATGLTRGRINQLAHPTGGSS